MSSRLKIWPTATKAVQLVAALTAVVVISPAQLTTLNEYIIPGGPGFASNITVGPDNALWFTDGLNPRIGRITTTGEITMYQIRPNNYCCGVYGIAQGPDGALWFTDPYMGEVGRITTTGTISEFSLPASTTWSATMDFSPEIVAGPDGAMWFTWSPNSDYYAANPYGIGRITMNGAVTWYTTSGPTHGITLGSDGALWFTEPFLSNAKIGRITVTGAMTEYADANGPERITAGPDGALWFTTQHSIGRITTAGAFTEFVVPWAFVGSDSITPGPGGDLWYTRLYAAVIGRVTTLGGVTDGIGSGFSGLPTDMKLGPDGALWFGERVQSESSGSPPSQIGQLILNKPVSHVVPLPATEQVATFQVQWSGANGIQDFSIYVSDNGGPFTAWLTNTTLMSASFTGQAGHSYGFYSIARDTLGDVEVAKSTAEATTTVSGPAIVLPTNVTVGPGLSTPFPVTLSSPAGPNGVFITLTSSDPTKVTLPPPDSAASTSFFIQPGATTSTRTAVNVQGVNFGSATITATAQGLASSSVTVQVIATLSFSPSSATLVGAAAQKRLTLMLSAFAPASGLTINLSSDNPAVATVPPTVTIPANAMSVVVPVTGVAAGSTMIHASALPFVSDTTASVSVSLALAITTTSLPDGQIGVPYSQTLTATGGTAPYTWTLSSGVLPGGLKLNASTGQISGTPIAPVIKSPLLFTVTDSSIPAQTAMGNLTVTIAQPPPTPLPQ